MCTRKYLSMTKSPEDTTTGWELSESGRDRNSLFRFHRVVNDDSLDVNFESYARIQHVATGTWLHGTEAPYRLKQYAAAEGSTDPMDKLEWDGAKLRRLGFSKEARYDDAFAIVAVPDANILNFNFAAGLVRPIENFVRRAQAGSNVSNRNQDQLSSYHYNVRCVFGKTARWETTSARIWESIRWESIRARAPSGKHPLGKHPGESTVGNAPVGKAPAGKAAVGSQPPTAAFARS